MTADGPTLPRLWATSLAALMVSALTAPGALACACCINTGQPYVAVGKLDPHMRAGIERRRFTSVARLYHGEADADRIKGITAPTESYELQVSRLKERWTFRFRDKAGQTGTLTLTLPATLAMFQVDPRQDEREGGTGPALYKEWRLTSPAAGTGIFTPGMRAGQFVALVLQGHGNNCTAADEFSHYADLRIMPRRLSFLRTGEQRQRGITA